MSKQHFQPDGLKVNMSIAEINALIGYVYKRTPKISLANLRNVHRLVKGIDREQYKHKEEITKRLDFIDKSLEARLEKKMDNQGLIIAYSKPDFEDKVYDNIESNLEAYKTISFSDIEYVTRWVEEQLHYGLFTSKVEDFITIYESQQSGDYSTIAECYAQVMGWVKDFMLLDRQISTGGTSNRIDFNSFNMHEIIDNVKKVLGDTSSIISTGIQLLNEMLGGGFKPTKLYTVLGVSGGFKSAMLLKMVLDCIRYNAQSFVPQTEGMEPVVLYVTMENTLEESVERTYNMLADSTEYMADVSTDEIMEVLKKEGIANNPDMGIVFEYRTNKSIKTSDLNTIIDTLAEEGREVCMMVFDYIKRILPDRISHNEKEELKNVMDELKAIAVDYKIPVITAHQMNRDALAKLEVARRDSGANHGKNLGASNTGSAIEVLENTDALLSVNLEEHKYTGQMYLTIQKWKMRYYVKSKVNYFNQPFHMENSFKLLDDIGLPEPLGVLNLSDDMDGVNLDNVSDRRGKRYKNLTVEHQEEQAKRDTLFNLTPANTNK